MDQLQVFIASAECWVMFSNFCDFVYLMKIEKWCRRRGFYLQYVLMCCCCTQTDEVSDDISPAAAAGQTHHDTPAPLHDVSFVSLTTHHSVPSHVCICLHVSCILVMCSRMTLWVFHFLPARRYASAGNSDRNVSVCLSVCPSRAGIVSKRRKLAAWFLYHLVAPRL